jgi:hypothetical protein
VYNLIALGKGMGKKEEKKVKCSKVKIFLEAGPFMIKDLLLSPT